MKDKGKSANYCINVTNKSKLKKPRPLQPSPELAWSTPGSRQSFGKCLPI